MLRLGPHHEVGVREQGRGLVLGRERQPVTNCAISAVTSSPTWLTWPPCRSPPGVRSRWMAPAPPRKALAEPAGGAGGWLGLALLGKTLAPLLRGPSPTQGESQTQRDPLGPLQSSGQDGADKQAHCSGIGVPAAANGIHPITLGLGPGVRPLPSSLELRGAQCPFLEQLSPSICTSVSQNSPHRATHAPYVGA